MVKAGHRWTFFRVGGFDQVSITSGDDIAHVGELDQKLWAALACPVKGLEFDERTLSLIDLDSDGRVRATEIIAAIAFADQHLKDIATVKAGSDKLPLAEIDDSTATGKALLSCARHILRTQGRPDDTQIALNDLEKAREAFAKTPFNGDGVITAAAAGDDAATAQAVRDIIACHGAVTDRDGQPGVDKKLLEAFFKDAAAFDAWWKSGEADAAKAMPLGATTLAAMAAMDAVATKVDDWFARCRLAAYDARAQQALNRSEKDYLAFASKDLALTTEEIRGLPLYLVQANAPLPLEGPMNPAWGAAIASMRALAVAPLIGAGKAELQESEWTALQGRFSGTRAWVATKAGGAVERLGIARVRALLAGDARAKIEELIAKDLSFTVEYDSITPVEKLVRLHRDLYRLLHNFVNFSDFYARDQLAVFQAGTLYLDGRSCDLVVRVDNPDKHATLGGLAKMYLAYCDCVRPSSNEKMTIAAAFTAGDADNLLVGRNGIFYDRKGRDWDATIVKVIENPISIRQAFWSPYKRAVRFVEEFVAKRAASAEQTADQKLTTGITGAAQPVDPKAPPQKPKLDLSIITGIGVALGAIAGALSGFLTALFGLGAWMPLGFAGLILGISLPSMVIAGLKLRQRNLGPILDANGWAVNGRVKINIPFGGTLTALPHLPPNSHRSLVDPYAEKKTFWQFYVALLVVAALVAWIAYDRWKTHIWFWDRLQDADNKIDPISGKDIEKDIPWVVGHTKEGKRVLIGTASKQDWGRIRQNPDEYADAALKNEVLEQPSAHHAEVPATPPTTAPATTPATAPATTPAK
jgi:hypothetical protein